MAASRALERGREGPQSVTVGTRQALQTIPAQHWEGGKNPMGKEFGNFVHAPKLKRKFELRDLEMQINTADHHRCTGCPCYEWLHVRKPSPTHVMFPWITSLQIMSLKPLPRSKDEDL